MSPLKKRCALFLSSCDEKPSVDEIMAFITAEVGRSADHHLERSLPLCIYFPTEAARTEFVAFVLEARPEWKSRKMP